MTAKLNDIMPALESNPFVKANDIVGKGFYIDNIRPIETRFGSALLFECHDANESPFNVILGDTSWRRKLAENMTETVGPVALVKRDKLYTLVDVENADVIPVADDEEPPF